MVFSSYSFIFLFLPIALAGYFLAGKTNVKYAALWLVLCSLAFYGWWDYRYVPLLSGSVVFNFVVGMQLLRLRKSSPHRTMLLAVGVIANLALLGYYKYAGFFSRNVNFNFEEVILPLGISFFTLTQVAFLVDASRGQAHRYSFVNYALFVTFFPHLLAGPILYHREMMPQFECPDTYRPHKMLIAGGLALFAVGLAKKVLLADMYAPIADAGFRMDAASHTAISAWFASLAYTLQLYFDFSGYSDMAIGIALMLGIKLPLNFSSPYKASSIIEFWRCWHMTLSRFLRDYLYVPLGGNRHGPVRRYFNLMLTMLLGGLWHGAGWQFVLWGGLHGAYLVANHAWRAMFPHRFGMPRLLGSAGKVLSVSITFAAVVMAWTFFRADSVGAAIGIIRAKVGLQGLGLDALIAQFQAVRTQYTSALDLYNSTVPLLSFGKVLFAGLDATYFNFSFGMPGQLLAITIGLVLVFGAPSSQQLITLRMGDPRNALADYSVVWRPSLWSGVAVGLLLAGSLYKLLVYPSTPFLYFDF